MTTNTTSAMTLADMANKKTLVMQFLFYHTRTAYFDKEKAAAPIPPQLFRKRRLMIASRREAQTTKDESTTGHLGYLESGFRHEHSRLGSGRLPTAERRTVAYLEAKASTI